MKRRSVIYFRIKRYKKLQAGAKNTINKINKILAELGKEGYSQFVHDGYHKTK